MSVEIYWTWWTPEGEFDDWCYTSTWTREEFITYAKLSGKKKCIWVGCVMLHGGSILYTDAEEMVTDLLKHDLLPK